MGSRQGHLERARERSRAQLRVLGADLRAARVQHGLSQAFIGSPAGLSKSQVSRIERGLVGAIDIEATSFLCAAAGLDLSIRAFPAGDPVRDAAHQALLARFRARLHPSTVVRTEVPVARAGDLRAWDAVLTIGRRPLAVEAETRPRDVQALVRRLALKARDGGMECLVLLLADTRTSRRLAREHASTLAAWFPLPGGRAVELLAAGVHPGASAVVLL